MSIVREEESFFRGKKRTKKIRETPDGKPFFSVFTGAWETYTKSNGKTGKRRVYEWQTENAQGARIPVVVWSQMVLASTAEGLGYKVMKDAKGDFVTTKAHKGDRTQGFEHQNAEEAEPAMVTIAKAALTDEEAGLVAPVAVEEIEVESQDEESELAEALGMSVEQYRKLCAENA